MKLYSSVKAYIVEDDGHRLICSKLDGRLSVDSRPQVNPVDLEEICDVILVLGRIDVDGINYLLFVSETTVVTEFSEHDKKHTIYRIDKVKALPLVSSDEIGIITSTSAPSTDTSTRRLKQGTGKLIKFVQDKIGNAPKQFSLLDEILRLFNERPSFYFCFDRDITHCTYRHYSSRRSSPDERFFWNKLLLKDLLDDSVDSELASRWIIPIMQGNVSFGSLSVLDGSQLNSSLNIILVSRRSVRRAGMRYLRRGIDCESNVANFVETELILNIFDHHLSFVQVRGSVPVFWSQKGFKYRPPLSIDKNIEESLPYFTTHMEELLDRYQSPLVAVSLVDQTGRELKLAASFVEHSARMNNPDLYLVSFDLHQHCRGLNFDKISELVVKMENLLEQIGYCWVDKTGEIVKTQRGVVRTSCVDCLDRTNLVQGAISQWVCMRQAQRLGLFGPLCDPPAALLTLLQNMWADNGDALSTQYAGTAALKGDVTRSGERRFAGIMRDGYNSASRYYLSHMRDSSRQKAINALLGYKDQGSESMVESSDSDSEEDENICRLVAETVHFLLPVGEIVVGAWALCDLQQSAETNDTILILTRTKLYVAAYDDDFEKLVDISTLPLQDISSIEVGKSCRSSCVYLRVTCLESSWTWRAGRMRVFNNVAIRLKTIDEAGEYTESIAEQISITINLCLGKVVPVQRVEKLSLPKSGNTARWALPTRLASTYFKKAIASVTEALKIRRRRQPKQTCKPTIRSLDRRVHKPEHEKEPQPVLIDSGASDSLESCIAREDVIDFRDDMNTDTAAIAPPKVHISPSEGCLTTESIQSTSSPSGGFIGRIRQLKTPFTKSNYASTGATDPFESLNGLLATTRTNFILL